MGLQGTYNFHGINIPDAYADIVSVSGGKMGGWWTAQVAVYKTKPVSQMDRGQPLETVNITAAWEDDVHPYTSIFAATQANEKFADMVLEEVAISQHITRLEFLQRFTQAERIAIYTAAKNSVAIEDYIRQIENATYIDLSRLDTIGGVNALEAMGLIAEGRADEILTPVT